MIRRSTKMQLIAFLVITMLGVSFVGARYVGITDRLTGQQFVVQADFPDASGIFTDAEVTYRGVTVGRVGPVHLLDDGVRVELDLDRDVRVPADTLAVIANRSAVGEQYVDLQPRTSGGPYLHHGSLISRKDTSIPLSTTQVLVDVDKLVNSVGRPRLSSLIDELGMAFAGMGPQLGKLIDAGDALTAEAQRNLPQTIKLIDDGATVLKTQLDSGSAIRSFAAHLASLTGQLRASDPDIRTVLAQAPGTADQVTALLRENRQGLGVLLANLLTLGRIQQLRLPGLRQILVTYPIVVAGGFTVAPGDGTAHFGLALNVNNPPPCTAGYGGRTPQVNGNAAAPVNTDFHCAAPRGSPTGVRGARNAPTPGDQMGVAGSAVPSTGSDGPVLVGYDPATGRGVAPNGQPFVLGDTGGQQKILGKDSWKWLLLAPLAG